MNQIQIREYQWFLKLQLGSHQSLAEDYAAMYQVLCLLKDSGGLLDPDLGAQLRIFEQILEISQKLNHNAGSTVAYHLKSLSALKWKHRLKHLRARSTPVMALDFCYLILREEEQLHDFLELQHQKLQGLFQDINACAFLEALSTVDIARLRHLAMLLREVQFNNREMMRTCQELRQDLDKQAIDGRTNLRFATLIAHCNSWGSKVERRLSWPAKLGAWFYRRCAALWNRYLFLWAG